MYTFEELLVISAVAAIVSGLICSLVVAIKMSNTIHNVYYLLERGWRYSRIVYDTHYFKASDEDKERSLIEAVERQLHLDKIKRLNIPDTVSIPQLEGKGYEAGSWSEE
jgi:hypothetical protein